MSEQTIPLFYIVRAQIFHRLGIRDPLLSLPYDVRQLVIASRRVVYEDADAQNLKALDKASEAFADRVPWDDEP